MDLLFKILLQAPPEIPRGDGPVDFSDPLNVILYIGGPIVFVIIFLFWRKRKNKD